MRLITSAAVRRAVSRGHLDIAADRDAFQATGRPSRLDYIDLASGGIDSHTEAGQLPIPEDGVAAFDGQRIDRPLGNPDGILPGHGILSVEPVGGTQNRNQIGTDRSQSREDIRALLTTMQPLKSSPDVTYPLYDNVLSSV